MIGAVILNWRDPQRTVTCVARLVASGAIGHVWVVDNESDGSLRQSLSSSELPRHAYTLIELLENRGFSAGMNAGLEPASRSADLVLAMNNDAWLDRRSIDALRARLEQHHDNALAAPVVVRPDGVISSRGGRLQPLWATDESSAVTAPDFVTWACVLLRSEALRDCGLLDEHFFMYWEDVEFCIRARRHGWSLAIVTDAVAVHEVSASHERAGGRILTYSTYGLVTIGRLTPGVRPLASALARVVLRAGKAISRGDRLRAAAHLKGAWLALRRPAGTSAWTIMRDAGMS